MELELQPWPRRWGERATGVIKFADPSWPRTVQDAWERYRQARGAADQFGLEEFRDGAEDAGPGAGRPSACPGPCRIRSRTACEGYSAAWEDWKYGPQPPAVVKDAMRFFLQLQREAEYLAGIHARFKEAEPKRTSASYYAISAHRFTVERAQRESSLAAREAIAAHDAALVAWKEWEGGLAKPIERGDFEADE